MMVEEPLVAVVGEHPKTALNGTRKESAAPLEPPHPEAAPVESPAEPPPRDELDELERLIELANGGDASVVDEQPKTALNGTGKESRAPLEPPHPEAAPSESLAEPPPRDELQIMTRELERLVAMAKRGDASALPRIREILDLSPEIWRQVGDAARHVQHAWLATLAGNDIVARESIQRHAEQLRRDLAGPQPTPPEAMLVDLVVNNWLEVQQAEFAKASSSGEPIMQVTHRLRRGESAQRKFIAAMKALTTLRTMLPRTQAPAAPAVTPVQSMSEPEHRASWSENGHGKNGHLRNGNGGNPNAADAHAASEPFDIRNRVAGLFDQTPETSKKTKRELCGAGE